MNRLFTLALIVLAGLLASCGSSVTSSTQAATNYAYSMVVSPTPTFTLNAGDWSSITATVDVSYENGAPKAVTPQPTIKFSSSDSRVTISPAGEVCAGLWDVRYLTCTPTSTLPSGYVTITAYDATRNVGATTLVSVHLRAANIGLSAPGFGVTETVNGATFARTCISQNDQVQYVAAPLDASGNAVSNVFDNDYTWSVGDTNVAAVSTTGYVVARNPGVTSVYATLNGTQSVPLTFVTCPPAALVLGSLPFTSAPPLPPFTSANTSDLDALTKGSQEYLTATLTDMNGKSLVTSPLSYITSDPLTGSFTTVLQLVSKLTANTSGRFSVVAACEPPTCNAAVADFLLPSGVQQTGQAAGFGYPIYSNVIGVTVQGITSSSVLVTGTTFADGVTPIHRLEVYDSESLANTHTIELANLPNSLVVAPSGATAYVGSSAGLMVVNLTTFQSALQTYPIIGGLSTDVITGQVLGVSPDSRYVVLSDTVSAAPNSYVFLIDTTGSKAATRYTISGDIKTVTFAADGSNIWVGGTNTTVLNNGVYVFNSDVFVAISANTPADVGVSTGVKALAWMPDGQSYFASGDQLANYSTCNNLKPTTQSIAPSTTGPINLDTTAIGGVPQAFGLSGTEWLDYSVTTTAQVPNPTTLPAQGNVCLSTVTVNPPVTTTDVLPCAATQVTFSPRLEAEFVTGVNPSCTATDSVIHGYSVATTPPSLIPLTATAPVVPLSGGVLKDGRKLYFGTWDSTAGTAALHRIDLSTGSATTGTLLDGTLKEDASTSVELVPSFVAVVPK
jgi:hypothetical protein